MKPTLNLGTKPAIIHVNYNDRIETSASSKGNQIKWFSRGENRWVKADFLGYEGLSECLAAWVANNTNIGDYSPVASYIQCHAIEDGADEYRCCYSDNFLGADESCITVHRLLLNSGMIEYVKKMDRMSTMERVKYIVGFIMDLTGINDFGEWLTCLLEFDYIVLNEDRHLNNIAVIWNSENKYKLMPLFDNGAAFCSDTHISYPVSMSFEICMNKVKSKPFNRSFSKQVSVCRELYGPQLRVNIRANDIDDALLDEFHAYPIGVRQRALSILRRQLYKWHGEV